MEVLEPEDAFDAWCKFTNLDNPAGKLLEKVRVVGAPGNAYGIGFDSYVRISFANSMDDLVQAIKRIKDMEVDK